MQPLIHNRLAISVLLGCDGPYLSVLEPVVTALAVDGLVHPLVFRQRIVHWRLRRHIECELFVVVGLVPTIDFLLEHETLKRPVLDVSAIVYEVYEVLVINFRRILCERIAVGIWHPRVVCWRINLFKLVFQVEENLRLDTSIVGLTALNHERSVIARRVIEFLVAVCANRPAILGVELKLHTFELLILVIGIDFENLQLDEIGFTVAAGAHVLFHIDVVRISLYFSLVLNLYFIIAQHLGRIGNLNLRGVWHVVRDDSRTSLLVVIDLIHDRSIGQLAIRIPCVNVDA